MYKDLAKSITDYMLDIKDAPWAMDIEHFDWVPGVGLYGIYRTWRATGDKKYFDFLESWIEQHLDEAYDQKTVNSTAPLLAVIEVYKENKNPKYLKVCEDIAAYIMNEAPLTREGGLEHTVTEEVQGFGEQIWADTLFMVCIFLAKLGETTGESKYSDFALNQLLIHHKLLSDKESGLYFHGWNCAAQNHMSSVRWGRANAWIIFSTAEILDTIGIVDEYKHLITNHADALKKCQRADGGFGTIVDDDASYSETSATAGIMAGLANARCLGVLDNSFDGVIEKAASFIRQHTACDGTVEMVSTGTPVMQDANAYKAIPCCPTLYGQGLAAIALTCMQLK